MNGAEKILEAMRRVGNADNRYLKKAEMLDETRCRIGNLVLGREDYLKPAGMEFEKGDIVIIYRLNETQYVILTKVV